jgi:hypothetical protein
MNYKDKINKKSQYFRVKFGNADFPFQKIHELWRKPDYKNTFNYKAPTAGVMLNQLIGRTAIVFFTCF